MSDHWVPRFNGGVRRVAETPRGARLVEAHLHVEYDLSERLDGLIAKVEALGSSCDCGEYPSHNVPSISHAAVLAILRGKR